jgi:hypothetical protein
MIEETEKDKVSFTMVRVELWDQRNKKEAELGSETWEGVMYALRKMVRSVDSVIPFQKNKVYFFAFCEKKVAKEIGERVQVKLTQGGYLPKGTDVRFKTYSYPKDSRNKDDFLKECRLLLNGD